MRSNWLILGMMIPLAVTIALWSPGSSRAVGAPADGAMASLYAEDGARVVTADVDALLEKGTAPPREDEVADEPPAWLRSLTDWLPEPPPADPVLVILVAGPERVAIARAGVADERIAAESPGAFVVGEDRMVAGSRDDAAEMLLLFDWVDRPIELFAVSPRSRPVAGKRHGTRNAGVAALPMLDGGVAAEVAHVRGADRARVDRAVDVARSALQ